MKNRKKKISKKRNVITGISLVIFFAMFLPILKTTPPIAGASNDNMLYLPLIIKQGIKSESSLIKIINIFYDGVVSNKEPDEYVTIRNDDTEPVQLQGWKLSDESGKTFTFPNIVITPNQECRIYTNEIHPEYCGLSFGYDSAIWNNTGDCATLYDAQGNLEHKYCY
jgi:hypothetical protein